MVEMTDDIIMKLGIDRARFTMNQNLGGPFGAVVVKDGSVVAVASNSVLSTNDPTAHAEINAIREACRVLGTYDLTGCVLYATGYPCPMCLAAIIWANIKKVYVSGTPKDAEDIGFRDDFIYRFINDGCKDSEILDIVPLDNAPAVGLYTEYANMDKTIY